MTRRKAMVIRFIIYALLIAGVALAAASGIGTTVTETRYYNKSMEVE